MVVGQLLFVLFLVAANGFFVAAEFALVKVRISQIDVLAQQGKWAAKLARSILEHLDAYLSACQLGITLASLGLGWVGEPMVARFLYPLLEAFHLRESTVHIIGFSVAFAAITFLHITVGEQAPKILAIQAARPTTLTVALPLVIFYQVFRPFIWGLNTASNLMLRAIGIQLASESAQVHTEEELRLILAESTAGGSLSRGERVMMENVLNLEEKVARQVMVPRSDIVFLSTQRTIAENYATVAESGHTRFPLCDGDLDHVLGMVHSKRLLQVLIAKEPVESIQQISQKVTFSPETMRLDALLRHFLRDRRHLAMLVDEYGVVSGMVTFEDVLEQLVGPIQDEFDREQPPIQKQPDGSSLVDAMCPVDLLSAECGLDLSQVSADTVGGLVIEQLGHIPKPGESFRLGNHELKVVVSDARRVRRLQVIPVAPASGNGDPDGAADETGEPADAVDPAEEPSDKSSG